MVRTTRIEKLLRKKIAVSTLLKYISTAIAILILLFLYRRGILAPLFVNGEPITFGEIVKVISSERDSNTIDLLIAEKVILFEAKKRNIEVKKEEVEAEIFRIEKEAIENGLTLVKILNEKDTTMEEMEKNIKTRIMLYKILSDDIEVTEEEVEEYIRENSDLFKEGEEELVEEEVKRILLDKKVGEMYESWIKDARAESEVKYLIDY